MEMIKKITKITIEELQEVVKDQILEYFEDERVAIFDLNEKMETAIDRVYSQVHEVDNYCSSIKKMITEMMDTIRRHELGVQNVYKEFEYFKSKISTEGSYKL